MKKISIKIGLTLLGLTILFGGCKKGDKEQLVEKEGILATTSLPQNVLQSCALTSTEFNTWFMRGNATENGMVAPANSVTFANNNNCDFYKWSAQMFLWITSPASGSEYGNSGTVMESPVFYTVSPPDVSGNRTLIPHQEGQLITAMANISKDGSIDTEEGQALTDGVLMSQKNSLVYYITMVNDVYVQYLTGGKAGKIPNKVFPTTSAELDSIVNYAKGNGVILKDANALTMELKTSWVDASTLADTSSYITMKANVPVFDKTNPAQWTPIKDSLSTVTLALVGAHVVGSVANHPEMIWATFEHKNNSPNLSYSYLDVNNKTQKVAADIGSDWLFNSNANDTTNVNIQKMKFKNNAIEIDGTATKIEASNTTRTNPWGTGTNQIPNPEDASVAAANSEVISLNNSLQQVLVGNDVRKNYIFLGATWTDGGAPPNGTSYSPSNTNSGVAIGTSQLANSTMETYAQSGGVYQQFGTCFGCHSGKGSNNPDILSHVFSNIQPLSTSLAQKSKIKK